MIRFYFLILILMELSISSPPKLNSKIPNIPKKTQILIKQINFDIDKNKDSLVCLKKGNDSIFIKYIKWGIDSTREKNITEIIYPDVKIVKSSYYVKEVNYDSIPDIVINIEYYLKTDTLNLHLISKQIILYLDQSYKKIPKIHLSNIKKFQRTPFLAQFESEDYLNTSMQYIRFNKKLIKEINKVNTDLLEEEKQLVQDVEEPKIEPNFIIFPNPANKTLTIKGNNFQTASFSIVDINGNKLLVGEIINSGDNVISIEKLATGVYTIIISDSQKILSVQKILVIR